MFYISKPFLFSLPVLAGVLLFCGQPARPAPEPAGHSYNPPVAAASAEPEKAMKQVRLPPGMKIGLFAAEPMLANPVTFCIDNKNRFFVAESFRINAGVLDVRGHMDWLDDMLACRTVEDNLAMLKRRLDAKTLEEYSIEHERIRLIEDTDGDGKADKATVFADGFKNLDSGIGAGLLARGNKVWYTCIPDFWLLEDTKGTGKADVRKKLHSGYGIHIAFYGHDLHGLRFGPDGRLYYSIGDRGANVRTPSGSAVHPDEGMVFRCNPDGTELEVFARGLRNPQELAFDEFGNLFTGDNNSDAGDQARWVHVVEGGDSGWRIGYQQPSAMGVRGPFMAEDQWKPQWDGQPAHLVPPLANLASGPAGLVYYPGLGLSARYKGHFFLCDFRGSPGGSGIRSLGMKPKGATFEVVDHHEYIWSVLATDVDFGTDCAMYVSDWVDGWGKTGKGRIYRITDPVAGQEPAIPVVKKLLAEGMDHRPLPELAVLLVHRHMGVRQEAQFALARKGTAAISILSAVARDNRVLLARVHAIWALGQIGRREPAALEEVLPLLAVGHHPEILCQAIKVVGDARMAAATDSILTLLTDAEPRVRFFAAQALGRIGAKKAIGPVLAVLKQNADQDVFLRHACVMALAGTKDVPGLLTVAADSSSSVRLGILLALRRLESPEIARFLNDADPRLVLEAARAINDVPIEPALPALAALIRKPGLPEHLALRVVNANFRLGTEENARAVAGYAARADVAEKVRLEALTELGLWSKPPGRDRIMGLWRPLAPRPANVAADAFRTAIAGIFTGPDNVCKEAAKVAAQLGIKEVGPVLFDMVRDVKRASNGRIEALRALETLKDSRLDNVRQLALDDADARMRNEGLRLLAKTDRPSALRRLAKIVKDGNIVERQGAFALLGALKGPEADRLLIEGLDSRLAGKLPAETHLDLLEAAVKHAKSPDVKQRLDEIETARNPKDHLARHRESLVGGDAENGRRIFFLKAEVSCLRCHKVHGEGGDVGPELAGIGGKQTREYLLESIVEPNRQIAKGFETTILALEDGRVVQGIVRGQDAASIQLMTPEGKLLTVEKKKIEERQTGKSAMPDDVMKYLSRSELRDLVEYLASLKEAPK